MFEQLQKAIVNKDLEQFLCGYNRQYDDCFYGRRQNFVAISNVQQLILFFGKLIVILILHMESELQATVTIYLIWRHLKWVWCLREATAKLATKTTQVKVCSANVICVRAIWTDKFEILKFITCRRMKKAEWK